MFEVCISTKFGERNLSLKYNVEYNTYAVTFYKNTFDERLFPLRYGKHL